MNLDENAITEPEGLVLTDAEIFTKIWTSPRLVFRYLNETRQDKFMYVLLFLAGIINAFDKASARHLGDKLPFVAVLALCIVGGGLLGWISYYIYAAMISWTGKWLEGKGDTDSLLRMISHAMIPWITILFLLIPQILIFGNEMFQSDAGTSEPEVWSMVIAQCISFVEAILGIWSLVLIVIGISEIQQLSIGKSILNMILPALIIIVPLAMIAFILGDLFGK